MNRLIIIALLIIPLLADTEPPNVTGFSFEPTVVNTALTSQDITFTIHLTDNESGISNAWAATPSQVRFESESGQLIDVVFRPASELISGTILDGVYVNTGTLSPFNETGPWTLKYIFLVDVAGNQRWMYFDEIKSLGLPVTFMVVNQVNTAYLPVVIR